MNKQLFRNAFVSKAMLLIFYFMNQCQVGCPGITWKDCLKIWFLGCILGNSDSKGLGVESQNLDFLASHPDHSDTWPDFGSSVKVKVALLLFLCPTFLNGFLLPSGKSSYFIWHSPGPPCSSPNPPFQSDSLFFLFTSTPSQIELATLHFTSMPGHLTNAFDCCILPYISAHPNLPYFSWSRLHCT